jgi:hypothetical protein
VLGHNWKETEKSHRVSRLFSSFLCVGANRFDRGIVAITGGSRKGCNKRPMNIEDFRAYCLSKPDATEGTPFGEDNLVFKVRGKMFALASLAEVPPSTT